MSNPDETFYRIHSELPSKPNIRLLAVMPLGECIALWRCDNGYLISCGSPFDLGEVIAREDTFPEAIHSFRLYAQDLVDTLYGGAQPP